MLRELQKHAAYSAALRRLALEKQAGLLKMVGGGLQRAGAMALAHPIGTLVAGGGVLAAGTAGRAAYQAFKPAVQRQQLGISQQP